jgi:dTDP-4-dehydrorhamnose 3,5-epimerase
VISCDLPLAQLKLIQRASFSDRRGLFSRVFDKAEMEKFGWTFPVSQINFSVTLERGIVRGMHSQKKPYGEDKMVSCVQGEIYDVAVDLRRNSKTFLQWHGEVLSAENNKSLLIPKGFAHGYQVLSEGAELIYVHSEAYVPESEIRINPNDPLIDISWPLPVLSMSTLDSSAPFLTADYVGY